jgi:hypothetical protein
MATGATESGLGPVDGGCFCQKLAGQSYATFGIDCIESVDRPSHVIADHTAVRWSEIFEMFGSKSTVAAVSGTAYFVCLRAAEMHMRAS